jgi:hypothetical protein
MVCGTETSLHGSQLRLGGGRYLLSLGCGLQLMSFAVGGQIAIRHMPPNNSLQTIADGAFNLTIESLLFKCRSSAVFEVGR